MATSNLSVIGTVVAPLGTTNINTANPPNTNAPGVVSNLSVASGGTSITIPVGTRYVVVQNTGAVSCWVGASGGTGTAGLVAVPAGTTAVLPVDTAFVSGVQMASTSTSQNASATLWFL